MNLISNKYDIDPMLKKFASALPNIVWITDAHGNVIYCNEYGLKFLGFEDEEINNEKWNKTIHPEELESITEKWMDVLKSKKPFRNIQRQKNKNNDYEWFKVTANPYYDINGELSHWVGTSININDEVLLRQDLEASNNRLDLSIKTTNSGTWDWDLENDSIVYNDNWWEMLGYKRGEMEEKTDIWEKLLHPEDKERATNELKQHLLGESNHYESIYRLKTKKGDWKWIYDSGKIIDRNNHGAPLRFVGIQQDYSSRKSNEDLIIESENKMRILADSAQKLLELENIKDIQIHIVDEIFKHIDGRGIVTFTEYNSQEKTWQIACNRGFSPLIGKISSILRRPIERMPVTVNAKVLDALKSASLILYNPEVDEALKGIVPKPLIKQLKKFINLDEIYGIGLIKNKIVYGKISIIPKDRSKTLDADFLETLVYQAACAIEKKKVEKEIVEKNRTLTNINEEMDLVIQGLSHDLKSPINTAKGILKVKEDISESEFIESIEISLNKLDDITKDLLDLVVNHRADIFSSEIDFKQLIEEQINELNDYDKFESIQWKIQVNQKEGFYSDRSRLKIVLRNLLGNSIKFQSASTDNSEVRIKVNCNQDEAIFQIADNGIGMNQSDLKHAFDIFYRASEDSNGSGLGLNIIKKTIEKLGGNISVDSEINRGTKFFITIPNLESV